MPKANFFLIGAAKAGTTSIARFLEALPETHFSPIKEPCHFCTDVNDQIRSEFRRQKLIDLRTYFEAGMQKPIHMHMVEKEIDYDQLFEGGRDATVLGECTTFYLPSHTAPANIYDYNPDARIMAVLRNPVPRIRSHYLMDQRIGLERRPLEDCIEEEIALGDKADFSNCRMYLEQSNYAPQIARYREVFGPDQMLVLKFEEVTRAPEVWMPEILRFLNLPVSEVPYKLPRKNSADIMPRFRALDTVLYKSGLKVKLRYYLPRILPGPIKRAVKAAYIGDGANVKAELSTDWESHPRVLELVSAYNSIAIASAASDAA